MEINYATNSFGSRIVKFLIKLSRFKNNTSSIYKTEKYIKKCSNKKLGNNIFKDMRKDSISDYPIYVWNGTLSNIKDSILIYVHGGSFIDKPLKMQVDFAKKVALKLDSTLIMPLYKTLPNGNSKIFLEEMINIYKYMLEKNKKIYLMGDSAGGGAILSLSLILKDKKMPLPNGVIALSPWLDLSLDNEKIRDKKDIICSVIGNKYCGKLWANEYSVKDYQVSPIYGDFKKIDKIFISCGGNELCQPDCVKFSNLLKKDNNNYKFVQFINQFHNFELYPIKESDIILKEIYNYFVEEE